MDDVHNAGVVHHPGHEGGYIPVWSARDCCRQMQRSFDAATHLGFVIWFVTPTSFCAGEPMFLRPCMLEIRLQIFAGGASRSSSSSSLWRTLGSCGGAFLGPLYQHLAVQVLGV